MRASHGIVRKTLGLIVVGSLIVAEASGAQLAPGLVDFGTFTPSASGGQFVEVDIKDNLIGMVARLASKQEPEVAEVLGGLKHIRVNVLALDDKNRQDTQTKITQIRSDLEAKGWEKIVTARQDSQDVCIFVKTKGQESVEGVVVTVIEGGNQAVLVNVVGNLKPEKLALIGERFNIEPLKKLAPEPKKS